MKSGRKVVYNSEKDIETISPEHDLAVQETPLEVLLAFIKRLLGL